MLEKEKLLRIEKIYRQTIREVVGKQAEDLYKDILGLYNKKDQDFIKNVINNKDYTYLYRFIDKKFDDEVLAEKLSNIPKTAQDLVDCKNFNDYMSTKSESKGIKDIVEDVQVLAKKRVETFHQDLAKIYKQREYASANFFERAVEVMRDIFEAVCRFFGIRVGVEGVISSAIKDISKLRIECLEIALPSKNVSKPDVKESCPSCGSALPAK